MTNYELYILPVWNGFHGLSALQCWKEEQKCSSSALTAHNSLVCRGFAFHLCVVKVRLFPLFVNFASTETSLSLIGVFSPLRGPETQVCDAYAQFLVDDQRKPNMGKFFDILIW